MKKITLWWEAAKEELALCLTPELKKAYLEDLKVFVADHFKSTPAAEKFVLFLITELESTIRTQPSVPKNNP